MSFVGGWICVQKKKKKNQIQCFLSAGLKEVGKQKKAHGSRILSVALIFFLFQLKNVLY